MPGSPPRPAQASRFEQESQRHEGQIDSGEEGQELILGQTARCREIADTKAVTSM